MIKFLDISHLSSPSSPTGAGPELVDLLPDMIQLPVAKLFDWPMSILDQCSCPRSKKLPAIGSQQTQQGSLVQGYALGDGRTRGNSRKMAQKTYGMGRTLRELYLHILNYQGTTTFEGIHININQVNQESYRIVRVPGF